MGVHAESGFLKTVGPSNLGVGFSCQSNIHFGFAYEKQPLKPLHLPNPKPQCLAHFHVLKVGQRSQSSEYTGVYGGYIGIMEKKMETTISGLGFRVLHIKAPIIGKA